MYPVSDSLGPIQTKDWKEGNLWEVPEIKILQPCYIQVHKIVDSDFQDIQLSILYSENLRSYCPVLWSIQRGCKGISRMILHKFVEG